MNKKSTPQPASQADQITQLVQAYNEAEAQQAERLRALFDMIAPRKGWRFVKFGNAKQWSNSWETIEPERHIDGLVNLITEVNAGEE